MAKWVEDEMMSLDLGDPRRKRRVVKLIEQLFSNPGASFPRACGTPADTKAAYRTLGSEEISAEEIRLAHARATVERTQGLERVIVVQDTTSLDFSSRPEIEGLGPLEKEGLRGLFVHSALALSPEGLPLGILHQQVWARDEEEQGKRHTRRSRHIEEKESFRWLEAGDVVESLLPADVEAWVAGDREADIYELFAMECRPNLHLVVRAAHNRKVKSSEGQYLREAVERSEVVGEMEVAVPRSRKRKERTAKLEVQICSLALLPPRHHLGRKDLQPVPVNVVRVLEKETTPRGEEPIEWTIITTVPVQDRSGAVEIVEAYAQRWKVERYHYVLKTGCGVENLQLGSADRIERALALFNVVAWRLLYMTYVARVAPELPCTAVLEEEEWQALVAVGAGRSQPVLKEPPTVREAVRRIAMLGGFQGRKGDGDPGVKALWTGYRRLMDFTFAFLRLRGSPILVGNG